MNSLRSTSLVIFALIILGAIIRSLIPADYDVTAEETVKHDTKKAAMSYLAFHKKYNSEQINQYQLIDIRDKYAFDKDHIPGAVNIPYAELLKKQGLSKINKKPVLVYGQQEATSAAAALLLYQLGFEKVNYLPGNFQTIKQFVLEEFDPVHSFYSAEKKQYNYQNYIRTNQQAAGAAPQKQTEAPKETINVSGGC